MLSDHKSGEYDQAELCFVPKEPEREKPPERTGSSDFENEEGNKTRNDPRREIEQLFERVLREIHDPVRVELSSAEHNVILSAITPG